MRTGVFLFGGVEFSDAGPGLPAPTDRRFDHKEVWRATERIIDMGVVCDRLGFDSFWLTEHHFQHEGYEVVPNGILVGTILAERTEAIRIGMAFNIVPQWHPLRLAEDFATLHNVSGGRGIWVWAGALCRVRLRRWAPRSAVSTTPTRPRPTT